MNFKFLALACFVAVKGDYLSCIDWNHLRAVIRKSHQFWFKELIKWSNETFLQIITSEQSEQVTVLITSDELMTSYFKSDTIQINVSLVLSIWLATFIPSFF